VLGPRSVWERARGGGRLAAAALLLVFLALSVPSFFGNAVALWSTGAYPDALHP
jgi:hypothetical protein